MILLWIIVIVLALTPVWIIWTPRTKVLRVKICLSVLSLGISILMMSACVQVSDLSDVRDNMMLRNQNYVDCINKSNDVDTFSTCVTENLKELNEIYWE